jgi:Rod binding domain-containing protein
MSAPTALPAPGLNAMDLFKANASAASKLKSLAGNGPDAGKAKAKAASQDFEAVFLNSMFQQMFTGIQGEGPMGGSGPTGIWRSFLTDEFARSFAKTGGIGIADKVYGTLLAQQEARS